MVLMREGWRVQERIRRQLVVAEEMDPRPAVEVFRILERQLAMAQGRLVGLSEAWGLVTGRSWAEVVSSGEAFG